MDHDTANPGAIPKGFTVEESYGDTLVIRHQFNGMGCVSIFLTVWLTGWTFGCIMVLYQYLTGGKMESGEPIPFWFPVPFWIAEIVVGTFFLYWLFFRKTFHMDRQNLVVENKVLGWRRTQAIPLSTIRRFIQVIDRDGHGEGQPGWALKAEATEEITLLRRQPYDKSYWLGRELAAWAKIEFSPCPDPSTGK